jgi:hypothetical protein
VPTDRTRRVTGDVTTFLSPTPGEAVEVIRAPPGTAANIEKAAVLTAVGRSLQNVKLAGPDVVGPARTSFQGWQAKGTARKNGKNVEFVSVALGDEQGHEAQVTAYFDAAIAPAAKERLIHVLDSVADTNR